MVLQGCTPQVVKTDVTVHVPPVGAYGIGKSIIVGDFKDGRTSLSPDEASRVHLKNPEWLRPDVILVLNEAPARTVGKAVEAMVQDAGFVLLKDQSGTVGDQELKVSGTLTGLGAALLDSSGGVTANVNYELTFARKGKVLATKNIRGEVKGHSEGSPDDVGLRCINKAMDRALRRTARYLSSANFQEDVLGMAANKAREPENAPDKDDDPHVKGDDCK